MDLEEHVEKVFKLKIVKNEFEGIYIEKRTIIWEKVMEDYII